MLNFFNDPTGEMPWEEEEGTENVQHIKTQQVCNLQHLTSVGTAPK